MIEKIKFYGPFVIILILMILAIVYGSRPLNPKGKDASFEIINIL